MLDKLHPLSLRYEKVAALLSDPKTLEDRKTFQSLSKELSNLSDAHQAYAKLKKIEKELQESQEILASEENAELKELAEKEFHSLKHEKEQLEKDALQLLLPKDPKDEGNAILEIRAGTGGDEAALFVADLARMYRKYAEKKHFQVGVIDASPTEIGGFKEIILQIEGKKAYYFLKNEAGTHRVQRIPTTETQGRVHTSAVTVAVLPETDEVEEIVISPADIKVDTYRSQGAGGQHVNTTDSAVRITHLPTGIIVACQEERSQIKNREKALKYLKVKIFEQAEAKQESEISSLRRTMVGSGDRSERIRTYNFPQGRLTDHRVKLTLYQLEEILNTGNLDEIIDQLLLKDRLEILQAQV